MSEFKLEDFVMDEETIPDFDDVQIKRLHNIWASEMNGCARKLEHRIYGEIEPLKKHFLSHRGSVVHRHVENVINKTSEPTYIDRYPEYKEQIVKSLPMLEDNAQDWMETTEIDMTEAEAEVKFRMDIGAGYQITRTIDLLTPTHIIDFKSGKKRNDVSKRIELAISRRIMLEVDGIDRKCLLVFLGHPEGAVELYPFDSKRTTLEKTEEDLDLAIQTTIASRELIRTGKKTPLKSSFLCTMCEYRHECFGI